MADNADNWGRLVAFANPELTKIAYVLRQLGELVLPSGRGIPVPLTPLDKVATVGPDRRQIHNVFRFDESVGVIQTVWGRTMAMDQISISPTGWLDSSGGSPNALLEAASRLMVAERVRLNTTPLVSLLGREKVLSNVWWSVKSLEDDDESLFALWLNSTPGLLLYIGELEVTEGGWVAIKKRSLENLRILQTSKLTEAQRQSLLQLYGRLEAEHFPLLKEQFRQGKEGRGLRFQLDTGLLSTLAGRPVGKDDLIPLYQLFCKESEHWESHSANPEFSED